MAAGFFISINEECVYECRDSRYPARLRRHLDEVDTKLEGGIQLGDDWVEAPDQFQKLQYTAMLLIDAVERQNENLVNLMSAYLNTRSPDLKEIRATRQNDVFNFSLIHE